MFNFPGESVKDLYLKFFNLISLKKSVPLTHKINILRRNIENKESTNNFNNNKELEESTRDQHHRSHESQNFGCDCGNG